MLEFKADLDEAGSYSFSVSESDKFQPEDGEPTTQIIDWRPIVISIINDLRRDIVPSIISARFHNTLAEIIHVMLKKSGLSKAVLSGGCFQNALLTERTISLLQKNNYQVYWHQRIPPNDGGIALGQIAAHLMKYNLPKENVIENQPVKEIG